ncbi:unnamed protein product [Rangifer tarandus platyrhynchus]|uniref:Uncharacterized protein n=2 Tax=Rangifer tarandus platyrhynchus TaxID=3082113 RepID=A0ABN8XS20_RANTA|nr:unnamed protein product [Rangifer tarandus platyrhynchus]
MSSPNRSSLGSCFQLSQYLCTFCSYLNGSTGMQMNFPGVQRSWSHFMFPFSLKWDGLSDFLKLAGNPTHPALEGRLPTAEDHVANFCGLLAVSLRSVSDILINGP